MFWVAKRCVTNRPRSMIKLAKAKYTRVKVSRWLVLEYEVDEIHFDIEYASIKPVFGVRFAVSISAADHLSGVLIRL